MSMRRLARRIYEITATTPTDTTPPTRSELSADATWGRECVACPDHNPDCQHPTCPRFPQPGHYHAMVVSVRDMAERAKRDGGLLDPYEVLHIVEGS